MNITIKDVARRAGLSIATVSKYLNGGHVLEPNRVRIEEAVAALGYRVNPLARGLKTSRTHTVGVLIPDLRNIFCTTIISVMENRLMEKGYSILVCDYGQDPRREREKLDFLAGKQVDGIVLMPSGAALTQLGALRKGGTPVVLLDRSLPDVRCDTVLVDNLNASYQAVELLITGGHRRIGIIIGPDTAMTARERLKGYLRVHEDYGLPADDGLIKRGDYGMDSGYRLLGELLDGDDPPTAVFVTNYEMSLGAVMAAGDRGVRFPDDLSFIGFDNLQLARVVRPPLTIVVQPMEEIGETAADALLRRMEGDLGNFPTLYRLKTSLLSGRSVGERIQMPPSQKE